MLLDELGRATDPEEGGALGVVLLETFRARGAFTLASTHLMAMKVYGASTAGVLNGSMGFDEETLEPTYVLRLGAPGKSAGLDIAARLGLGAEVIEAARERMTNAERDVSRFLAELHKQMAAIEEERARVAAREQAVEARERSLEQTWERKYAARTAEIERRAAELSSEFERRAQETSGRAEPEGSRQGRKDPARVSGGRRNGGAGCGRASEFDAGPSETRGRRARASERDPAAGHGAEAALERSGGGGRGVHENAGDGGRHRGGAARRAAHRPEHMALEFPSARGPPSKPRIVRSI